MTDDAVIKKFTRRVPHWRPRVTPVDLGEATEAQRDAMKVTPSNRKVSDYILTLAHDPESLAVRSPLFNAIMYHDGGLDRAGRELGAVAASIVNRCVYCAAVHAGRMPDDDASRAAIDEIFGKGEAAVLEGRAAAIFAAGLALSRAPSAFGPEHVEALTEAGVSQDEILDLVLSVALFGWANRLMHVLGDPVRKDTP
ncbi:alkylhydroperoxidase [Rhodobacteraceae bacterium CCMM004]|nr:alkylhydroperoxidase [Rhodobacteraceae bacterium CCMM004]